MRRRAGSSTANEALTLVVDALSAYRITRLITKDTLTEEFRERVIAVSYDVERDHPEPSFTGPRTWHETFENDDDPPKLAYLITCPFCVSVYVAAGVVVARSLVPWAWRPVARAAALAGVVALIAEAQS